MAIGETTVELVNSCSRMMDLLDAPQEISFFGKLIQREIIYRLLQGSQGARLRAIATLETKCHRTAKAVAWLRSNYKKPLRVEHLATISGMSRSTLHHHFRALTAMSPLQFQKQLRLHAARQRMLTGELDAASAAFEVGYESPSQFNREYRRFLVGPQFAISRPCETAKLWRSLPLDAELLGCHGATCFRLSQRGLRALALIELLRTL
jgi:AraC-like DNA-binding protein